MNSNEWDNEESALGINLSDSSAVRIALLFGSAAIAFALILMPFVNRGADSVLDSRASGQNLDYTPTASIGREKQYTIRRSVLQPSPASVCFIKNSGGRSGDC